MVVRREEVDDPVDGLDGVDRVERAEHEVARLGRAQRRADRLLVAHLADQDHVGVLAQHAPERLGEGVRVEADLALVDDRLLVAVQILDRVLDRDDVRADSCVLIWSTIAASVVDLPEPVVPVTRMIPRGSSASRATTSGRPELVDRADAERHDAAGDRDRAALAEGVDAEARETREPCRRSRSRRRVRTRRAGRSRSASRAGRAPCRRA